MIRNGTIWPTLCLLVLSLLSKELNYVLIAVTAAFVVQCGGPKSIPVHHPWIVHIIFWVL